MRFGILGPLAVWTAGGETVPVPERKVRMLLAALLIHRGEPVSADRLTDHLWGATPPERVTNTLQTKVSQLRRVLDAAEPDGRGMLTFGPAGYTLHVGRGAMDADRFTELSTQARSIADPRRRAALFGEALALWRGDALADFADEPFAQAAIARMEEERLAVLEERAEARLQAGQGAALTAELGSLVTRYPLRERMRAAQMRALYTAGRQEEALRSYRDLRERLADELGIDPGTELVALHQSILEQDPELVIGNGHPHVAADESPADRGNLPAPLTELIGRESALVQLRQQLRPNRLVTLTGPGGVGKTRLAVAAASSDDRHEFPETWLVELAALPPATSTTASGSAVEAVAEHIGTVLGIRAAPARGAAHARESAGALDRLLHVLRGSRMLVILDNCEHVVEPVADVVQRLLASAPDIHVLATSREPLDVSGEIVWPVPQLDLPPASAADPAVLSTYSAVRLFVSRAAAASPGFELTAENAAATAKICHRLDGIPLALELAASRVRALGVHDIAARLDDRFRLFSAGKRGVPARQRTLRAVIDWSWELLTGAERSVLRRLSVHADSCTLDAAEAVCAGAGVAAEDVPQILARLVDRSLVVTYRHQSMRYGLLETVSEYCRERLADAGETDHVRQLHCHYYLGLAERAERHLRGPGQRDWLNRLDAESANLRRVLDNAVHDGAAELSQRLASALAWYWSLRGRPHEAARSLARALGVTGAVPAAVTARARTWHAAMEMLGNARRTEPNDAVVKLNADAGDTAELAHAQWLLGYAEFGFGSLPESARLTESALSMFRAAGSRWGIAAALGLKASQEIFRGDPPAVHRHAQESLTLFDEVGDGWGRLQALGTMGTYAEITGDYEAAESLFGDVYRLARELELWDDLSTAASRLGRIALLRGDHARADEMLRKGRQVAVDHANLPGQEFADLGLALSARHQGRLDDAEALLHRWLDWNREIEAGYGVALILVQLGFVAELRGDAETARTYQLDGLSAARATGDVRAVALALEGLAGAESLAGRHPRAARLLGTAAAARDSVGVPLPAGERHDVDRVTARTSEAIGTEAFRDQFAYGRTRTPDDVA